MENLKLELLKNSISALKGATKNNFTIEVPSTITVDDLRELKPSGMRFKGHSIILEFAAL